MAAIIHSSMIQNWNGERQENEKKEKKKKIIFIKKAGVSTA